MFSIAHYLGAEILSTQALAVGTLHDVILQNDVGIVAYYIIKAPATEALYAIPPSYFIFSLEYDTLTFDLQRGSPSAELFPDLPEAYEDGVLHNCTEYIQAVLLPLQPGHHRTDDE